MTRLDIFADPVCPWCYLGKAALDRAMESRPHHPFVVAWHPFRLSPEMPAGGMDRAAYLRGIFGSEEAVVRAHVPIMERAAALGLEINLGAMTRMPSTLDAHRLVYWAGLEGRQTPVMAALLRGYWRDGRDIGAPEVLAGIAGEAGLDRAMVARLLASDADRAEIEARDAHARSRGIRAVPTFVIGDTHAVSGAQPVELWQNVIDELAEQDAGISPPDAAR